MAFEQLNPLKLSVAPAVSLLCILCMAIALPWISFGIQLVILFGMSLFFIVLPKLSLMKMLRQLWRLKILILSIVLLGFWQWSLIVVETKYLFNWSVLAAVASPILTLLIMVMLVIALFDYFGATQVVNGLCVLLAPLRVLGLDHVRFSSALVAVLEQMPKSMQALQTTLSSFRASQGMRHSTHKALLALAQHIRRIESSLDPT